MGGSHARPRCTAPSPQTFRGSLLIMARLILLDSGPLGMIVRAPSKPQVVRCITWLKTISATGATVVIPEIADYEVRRELLRIRAVGSLRRLERYLDPSSGLGHLTLSPDAMIKAAWRRPGSNRQPPGCKAVALRRLGTTHLISVQVVRSRHVGDGVFRISWDSYGDYRDFAPFLCHGRVLCVDALITQRGAVITLSSVFLARSLWHSRAFALAVRSRREE